MDQPNTPTRVAPERLKTGGDIQASFSGNQFFAAAKFPAVAAPFTEGGKLHTAVSILADCAAGAYEMVEVPPAEVPSLSNLSIRSSDGFENKIVTFDSRHFRLRGPIRRFLAADETPAPQPAAPASEDLGAGATHAAEPPTAPDQATTAPQPAAAGTAQAGSAPPATDTAHTPDTSQNADPAAAPETTDGGAAGDAPPKAQVQAATPPSTTTAQEPADAHSPDAATAAVLKPAAAESTTAGEEHSAAAAPSPAAPEAPSFTQPSPAAKSESALGPRSYEWEETTVRLVITMRAKGGSLTGRPVILSGQTYDDNPVIRTSDESECRGWPPPVLEIFEQLRRELPARRGAYADRKRAADEAKRLEDEKAARDRLKSQAKRPGEAGPGKNKPPQRTVAPAAQKGAAQATTAPAPPLLEAADAGRDGDGEGGAPKPSSPPPPATAQQGLFG